MDKLRGIIISFQAMLLYCRFTKCSFFYSFPYFSEIEGSNLSASLSLMNTQEFKDPIMTDIYDLCEIIFKPIMNNELELEKVVTKKFEHDISINKNKQMNDTVPKEKGFSTENIISSEMDKVIKSLPQNSKINPVHLREIFTKLCFWGSNLKNKKHEGNCLQFAFVLAPVSKIGVQFKPIHLLKSSIILELNLFMKTDMANSIINGNFAFLQDDAIALFAPFPFGELTFTHIIDLSQNQDPENLVFNYRENLLRYSSGGDDVFIFATFKDGTAVLYNNKKQIARAKHCGDEWKSFDEKSVEQVREELTKKLYTHLHITYPDPKINDRDPKIKSAKLLIEVIMAISKTENKGAVFLIGQLRKITKVNKYSRQMTQVFDIVDGKTLNEITKNQLFDMATQDGATIIDSHKFKISGRWQLPSIDPSQYQVDYHGKKISIHQYFTKYPNDRKTKWKGEDYSKTNEWGTRHLAAWASTFGDLKYELNSKITGQDLKDVFKVLTICISTDGPIHVFKQGRSI